MDQKSAAEAAPQITDYRKEWLASVQDGAPNTVQLGHRFSRKLVTQWLDVDEADDNIVYCDGAGEGGIDVAYLHKADMPDSGAENGPVEGDI